MRFATGMFAVLVLAASLCPAQTSVATVPKYDPATEATLKGTIDQISQVKWGKDTHVELVMKSGTNLFDVGVCPPDVFKELIVSFAAGDEVEVIGSKVQLDQKPFIMAREIVKGNDTLDLRDKKGSPVWMWMRR